MKEIILCILADKILSVIIAGIVLSFMAAFLYLMMFIIIDEGDYEEPKHLKMSRNWFISGCVLLLLQIAVPSTKDLYVILGVGSTIDYVRGSDAAKELPDKAILALDKLCDEYLKEEK